MAFSSFTIVGAGERGVVVSATSGVTDEILGEGFHFKTPFIDRVVDINVQTQKVEQQTASTSQDQQIVNVKLALNYHANPDSVNKLYQEIGNDYVSRIILPALEDSVKATMAQYKAEDLIKKRDEVGLKAKEHLMNKINNKYVTVDGLNIIEIDFSDSYNLAIEAKVTAEQEVEREKNVLEQIKIQKEQTIIKAEAEKQKSILEAEAQAEKILIEANAQSEAIEKINSAIAQNEQYLTYQWISQWNGVTPTMVNDGSGFIVDLKNKVQTME